MMSPEMVYDAKFKACMQPWDYHLMTPDQQTKFIIFRQDSTAINCANVSPRNIHTMGSDALEELVEIQQPDEVNILVLVWKDQV